MVCFARNPEDTKIDQIMFLSLHFLQFNEGDEQPVCYTLGVKQRTHLNYGFTRPSFYLQ